MLSLTKFILFYFIRGTLFLSYFGSKPAPSKWQLEVRFVVATNNKLSNEAEELLGLGCQVCCNTPRFHQMETTQQATHMWH